MSIIIKARCHIVQPNWRVVKYMFYDLEKNNEEWGEYIAMNLLRERGMLQHDRPYRVTVDELFPYALKE